MAKILAGLFAGASAQTLTNCNPDGPAKITTFEIVPDPPKPGQPAEIHFAATFPTSGNHLRVVVDAQAGPIDIKAYTFDMNVSSQVGKPNQEIAAQIGPFTWPNLNIPLIPKVKGQVKVSDIDSPEDSPVCIQYAIKIEHDPSLPTSGFGAGPPFTTCLKDGEVPHLTVAEADLNPPAPKKGDAVHSHFKGAVLDEDITEGVAEVDVDITIARIPLSVPFTFTPSVGTIIPDVLTSSGVEGNSGDFKLLDIPLIPNAKGSVRITDKADGSGEVVQCINFNMPVEMTV